MNNSENFFYKFQIPLFFGLAYLLSWWFAPLSNGQIIPQGPALAAVLVVALAAGRPGVREWWRRVTHWRTGWQWYLIGPAIILGYQGTALVINLLFGAVMLSQPTLPAAGILLELVLVGGWWEEPGWSGYALPKLQERFADRPGGILTAALILGLFRAIWHLPLLLYGHIAWFDIFIFSFVIQIIIAWLYNRSGGSVPVVMVFHFISNIMGAVRGPVFSGADSANYYALFVIVAAIVALVLAWNLKTDKNGNSRIRSS